MTDTRQEGDASRLVEFLHNRDAPCPHCGYNLRNLTDAVCPECRHELRLTVGVHHMQFGWFLATVTPSLFSGIAAVLMLILMLTAQAAGASSLPLVFYVLVLPGLASGGVAVALITRRHRFVRLRPQVQRTCAMVMWGIHGLPFLGLVILTMVTT